MSNVSLTREPVRAADDERAALLRLKTLLDDTPVEELRLVGANGAEAPVPETTYRLLRELVTILVRGHAVRFETYPEELTLEQAADILNVSRRYFIELLERGEIPHITTEMGQRVHFGDLMSYKRRRDTERKAALQALTRMSQEWGLYDADYSFLVNDSNDRG